MEAAREGGGERGHLAGEVGYVGWDRRCQSPPTNLQLRDQSELEEEGTAEGQGKAVAAEDPDRDKVDALASEGGSAIQQPGQPLGGFSEPSGGLDDGGSESEGLSEGGDGSDESGSGDDVEEGGASGDDEDMHKAESDDERNR